MQVGSLLGTQWLQKTQFRLCAWWYSQEADTSSWDQEDEQRPFPTAAATRGARLVVRVARGAPDGIVTLKQHQALGKYKGREVVPVSDREGRDV